MWDAKSGDLLASGTAAMCARRLGYASAAAMLFGLTIIVIGVVLNFVKNRISKNQDI